jgi:hypothetical protein
MIVRSVVGMNLKCLACDGKAVHEIEEGDKKHALCDLCCFCGIGNHIIVVREVGDSPAK